MNYYEQYSPEENYILFNARKDKFKNKFLYRVDENYPGQSKNFDTLNTFINGREHGLVFYYPQKKGVTIVFNSPDTWFWQKELGRCNSERILVTDKVLDEMIESILGKPYVSTMSREHFNKRFKEFEETFYSLYSEEDYKVVNTFDHEEYTCAIININTNKLQYFILGKDNLFHVGIGNKIHELEFGEPLITKEQMDNLIKALGNIDHL